MLFTPPHKFFPKFDFFPKPEEVINIYEEITLLTVTKDTVPQYLDVDGSYNLTVKFEEITGSQWLFFGSYNDEAGIRRGDSDVISYGGRLSYIYEVTKVVFNHLGLNIPSSRLGKTAYKNLNFLQRMLIIEKVRKT